MAEYQLQELARASGVSARNIRAYRERGLLDPPRRVGRSALYDDYHLSQLNTISELLRKGFTSTHIAEFFTSMRQGTDLADILGLQRAVLGPRTTSEDRGEAVGLDADTEEARKLVSYGLADIVAGKVVMVVDGVVGEILSRSPDRLLYVRALVKFLDAADGAVNDAAKGFVASLNSLYRARVGAQYLPRPDEMDRLREVVQDYRELGAAVLAARFDEATRRLMVTSATDYTAGILFSGEWEPREASRAE
ncbi:MerR family transcriptional regulator [Mycolicibacterium hippocampi]|uniref:HTH merR-type domain-containing protein n=1 Tax=Mycolicibacterium hippocampi TaxID=659824 RepID=A0A7I9ZT95_9MYCO|nr:MerR family transcriptional regulator [Mycolicibacterium hippocampi]GFH04260.1 hypothetical protein MHIP_47430 [Mycolicibacterium hippocampi]